MAVPASTYRIQVRPGFDLGATTAVLDYLGALGAGAVYCSPLLQSASGSEHGYDVVDHSVVDAPRGGEPGWQLLTSAAAAAGLGIVVDIVPNHAGVADAAENAAWWDLLQHGRQAQHALWFDVEWSRGRLLLPVLGDDFADDQLTLDGGELHYFEHRFPVRDGSSGTATEVAADQYYELANYRRADREQNYRRFFAVTSLAGLRVEDEAVYAATHERILRWAADDRIAGLRIDHPDGLADPRGYLRRLAADAPDAWITVEKILEPGESLPDWPVAGTTGYDALAEVSNLFVDPAGQAPLDAVYRELTGDTWTFADHVAAGKRLGVDTILRAEVNRLARLVPDSAGSDVADAIAALLVAFPTYRSYLPDDGTDQLHTALATVAAHRPELRPVLGAIGPRLHDPHDELCIRFQQTSGAVMAKGVEDTAYYRYTRFVALNEVGGDPGRFGAPPQVWHDAQVARQLAAPESMTTLSTHDTKRGEDVRARLFALAELPQPWSEQVRALMRSAPIPDPGFAYLLWQTFVGTGFIERGRMHGYATKAMREAAVSTTWTDPDTGFEAAVHAAVDAAYDSSAVREPLARLIDAVIGPGRINSLGQKLAQLTMPGIPDVYQGTEIWEDSLVDPDNRRPVDFAALRGLLESTSGSPPAFEDEWRDGAVKFRVVRAALRLRRARPDLFCGYTPMYAEGAHADHAVAFDRGGAITVVTRLPVGLARSGGWGDTTITLDGNYRDEITGATFAGRTPLAELMAQLPVALLVAQD